MILTLEFDNFELVTKCMLYSGIHTWIAGTIIGLEGVVHYHVQLTGRVSVTHKRRNLKEWSLSSKVES